MCIVEKEWPKVKKETDLYVKQSNRLMFYFLNIEDDEIRKDLLKLFAMVYKTSKQEHYKKKIKLTLKHFNLLKEIYDTTNETDLPYLIAFSRCINKIHSIALKDQALEMMKMMAL
jgi:hypothetical protein